MGAPRQDIAPMLWRSALTGALALALMSLSVSAWAQAPEDLDGAEDDALPVYDEGEGSASIEVIEERSVFEEQRVEDEELVEPVPVEIIVEEQAPREDTTRAPGLGLAPSILLGGAHTFGDGFDQFHLWTGMKIYPKAMQWSPMLHLGLSMYFDEGVEVAPTLRAGVAFLPEDPEHFLMQMFPALEVYGIMGMYLPSALNPQTLRAGVGFTSPMGLIVTLIALGEGAAIPNSIELIMEQDLAFGERRFVLQYGFGF